MTIKIDGVAAFLSFSFSFCLTLALMGRHSGLGFGISMLLAGVDLGMLFIWILAEKTDTDEA